MKTIKEDIVDGGEKHYDVNSPGKRSYYEKMISNYFGPQNQYTGSADWGGMPVWTIKGDKFQGIFLIIDDNENIVLLTRKHDEMSDENVTDTLAEADGEDLQSVVKVINQALKIKDPNSKEIYYGSTNW